MTPPAGQLLLLLLILLIPQIDLPKDVQYVSSKSFTKESKPSRIHPYDVKVDLKRKKILIKRKDVKTGWSNDLYLKGYQRKPVKQVCLDSKKLFKTFIKIKRAVRKNRYLINKRTRMSVIRASLIRDKNMLRHLNRLHSIHRHKDIHKLIGKVKVNDLH